jgi:hypothetical protein
MDLAVGLAESFLQVRLDEGQKIVARLDLAVAVACLQVDEDARGGGDADVGQNERLLELFEELGVDYSSGAKEVPEAVRLSSALRPRRPRAGPGRSSERGPGRR